MSQQTIHTEFDRKITIEGSCGGVYIVVHDTWSGGRISTALNRKEVNAIIGALAEMRDEEMGKVTSVVSTKKNIVRSLSPQAAKVLTHLKDVGTISAMEASTIYKVRALPRRIADLKALGHNIISELKVDHEGQRYARYSLAR